MTRRCPPLLLALAVHACAPPSDDVDAVDEQHATRAQPIARDDIVLAARPGQAVLVDVLANDRARGRRSLTLTSATTNVPGATVQISEQQLLVEPPAGFTGVLDVRYVVRSGSSSARARLTVHVDSYFDDLIAELTAGAAGERMIDAYDEDGAAPYQPQLALVVQHRGRRVLERTWGGFDVATTRQPLASATKWFAAVLTLIARDEGRIQLDDPMQRHLPGFAAPALDGNGPRREDITFRQAFSMSSGLYSAHRYHTLRRLTHEASVEMIRNSDVDPGNGLTTGPVPMAFEGGTMVGYDGKAMHVAGLAILSAYGDTYDWLELADEKLFGPCAMNDTTYDAYYPNNPAVAGGAQTTADDYLKFLDMIRNGGRCGDVVVLSAESIADLFRFHLDPIDGAPNRTPIFASPWPNCGTEPYGDGDAPDDCSRWLDGTPTGGSLYPNGNDTLRYGFGAWVMAESDGVVEALVSPGAWGTSPFYDRSRDLRGIMFTYVAPEPSGVRPVTSANTYVFRRLRAKIDALLADPNADLAPAIDR